MEKGTVETVNEFYDERLRGGGSTLGFMNIGYWKGVENSLELAQINLIETLVNFFSRRDGNVLDVACGQGASSRFLMKYFNPKNITGINISEKQLDVCRAIAPQCNFKLMDATRLEFADSSFDNVLCIEAAGHFMTRQKFLEEAYRVLKPAGRLAMSEAVIHDHDCFDILGAEGVWPKEAFPKENQLPNLNAYRENLLDVGFKHVRVKDITEFSWIPFAEYLVRAAASELDRNRDSKSLEDRMDMLTRSPWIPPYCSWYLVYAIKPS